VIEELLFFFVVPMCALLTFEATRTMRARGARRTEQGNTRDSVGAR
jgi:hypothetical protein